MSKIKIIILKLGKNMLVETQFRYFWKNQNRRVSASYSFVFKVDLLSKCSKDSGREELDNCIVTSNDLGLFFVEKVLSQHILPIHTKDVTYSRVQFRIPDPHSQNIEKFNYEIVALRGTGVGPQDDPNVISGDYSCRFSNVDQQSALSLRIKNVVSRPKLDYFIDNLCQPMLYEENEVGGDKIEMVFVLAGLTLNKTYDSLYNFFDIILEKIQ